MTNVVLRKTRDNDLWVIINQNVAIALTSRVSADSPDREKKKGTQLFCAKQLHKFQVPHLPSSKTLINAGSS